MEFSSEIKENYIIAKPFDKVDATNADDFAESMLDLFKNCKNVVLDFTNLNYISSAGLRSVLIAAKEAQNIGGSFVLCSMQEHIFEIFKMTGFTEMLKIVSNLEEAVNFINNS